MKTKYIKVAVSDELPKEKGIYLVWNFDVPMSVLYDNVYGFHEEFTDCSGITHWLKEVPDHEAELLAELKNARVVIGKLKRSIAVHPDCTEDSEFDDYSTMAQECEDDIERLIQKLKSDETKTY